MCGIAGIFYLKENVKKQFTDHSAVLKHLRHRGPDHQQYKTFGDTTFYHSRLVILDLSISSNQPFEDEDGNFAMVFNGEIFNYRELARKLEIPPPKGDVEVLFKSLIINQRDSLNALNGFFALALLDRRKNQLLLARDRFGVKPLYYYFDEEKLVFASELKPLLQITGPLVLNEEMVYTYFRLNYCAGSETIYKNVYRLLPGSCLEISHGKIQINTWYQLPPRSPGSELSYLLEDAVKLRLHADMPVGSFLSGGLDSSIISALAKQHKIDLKTFSIGFRNHAYFDESRYAEIVAKHLNTSHYTYSLSEDDFLNELPSFLNGMDEPFADSSALNLYILSKRSSQEVKVALSGDGADELFKGYLKHRAVHASQYSILRGSVAVLNTMTRFVSASREQFFQNAVRKLRKFSHLSRLDPIGRQKFLASISSDEECRNLLKPLVNGNVFSALFATRNQYPGLGLDDSFDMQVVLPDDMLVKTDRFSMLNSQEIRNPFLDYRIVNLALRLDQNEKISWNQQKIILKKQFGHLLPKVILERKKKGFELPLLSWLRGQLSSKLDNDWLNESRIRDEGWLNYEMVKQIRLQMLSNNPGDSAARLWAVVVFQNWLSTYKPFIQSSHAKSTAHHQPI